MMNKEKYACDLIEKYAKLKILDKKKWLLSSTKICFKGEPAYKNREQINKCLRSKKIKIIWANNCVVVK